MKDQSFIPVSFYLFDLITLFGSVSVLWIYYYEFNMLIYTLARLQVNGYQKSVMNKNRLNIQ